MERESHSDGRRGGLNPRNLLDDLAPDDDT